ncbi:hypothetical protein [Promicromonospora soli]|uniref:hypothetical protein n=1 Tax=Promicromonospora soli TaxID=2035533 RepID=UPI001E474DAE|nr:hypothetical protein [Promicromonospora soli]
MRTSASGSAIALSFSGAASCLPSSYLHELGEGIAAVTSRAAEHAGDRPVAVDIEDVQFNETDFQVEGLPVAMCRWAEQAFGLPPRKIIETFDRDANRYRFEWA